MESDSSSSLDEEEISSINIPKDFVPLNLNNSSEYHENIEDDNIELFLFQFPSNFDVQKIHKKKLKFKPDTGNGAALTHTVVDDIKYGFIPSAEIEYNHLVNIFPSNTENRLKIGKPFKSQFHIVEDFEIPEIPPQQNENRVIEQKTGLKVRYRPSGSESIGKNTIDLGIEKNIQKIKKIEKKSPPKQPPEPPELPEKQQKNKNLKEKKKNNNQKIQKDNSKKRKRNLIEKNGKQNQKVENIKTENNKKTTPPNKKRKKEKEK